VIVYNMSREDVDDTINGRTYKIAGGGSLEMSRREAIDLRGHMPPVHENGNKSERMFQFEEVPSSGSSLKENTKKCPVCGEDFLDSQEDLFRQHLVKHANQRIKGDDEKPENAEVAKSKVYLCPRCDREFDTGSGMKIHLARCKGMPTEAATAQESSSAAAA
jgi:ribosomal protein S27AE